MQSARIHADADSMVYWYNASSDYNPAPDLEKIKAKLLVIFFGHDQISAALDREMQRVKNGRYVIVPAGKESDGEGNNTDAKLWRSYMEELLHWLTHTSPSVEESLQTATISSSSDSARRAQSS